jgi:predicted aspartyl protease
VGLFKSKLIVWNPEKPQRQEEFDLWVDTGAAYSWLSRKRLETLGIRAVDRMQFRTIEGRIIERELAPVFLRVNGHTGGDNVVLAEETDMEVLGSHTLESLGLAADPVQKKLVRIVGLALAAKRVIQELR